jgi:hypothetical protein
MRRASNPKRNEKSPGLEGGPFLSSRGLQKPTEFAC